MNAARARVKNSIHFTSEISAHETLALVRAHSRLDGSKQVSVVFYFRQPGLGECYRTQHATLTQKGFENVLEGYGVAV